MAPVAEGRVHPQGRPLSLEDAPGLVEGYVEHYTTLAEQRGGLHHPEGDARGTSTGGAVPNGIGSCGRRESSDGFRCSWPRNTLMPLFGQAGGCW